MRDRPLFSEKKEKGLDVWDAFLVEGISSTGIAEVKRKSTSRLTLFSLRAGKLYRFLESALKQHGAPGFSL